MTEKQIKSIRDLWAGSVGLARVGKIFLNLHIQTDNIEIIGEIFHTFPNETELRKKTSVES